MANFTPTGVEFVAKNINKYLGDLKKADKAQQGLGDSVESSSKSFNAGGKSLLGFGAAAASVAATGVVALGAATVAVGAKAINTAIQFESAFTGVTKTIDNLSDSTGKLTDLGNQIRTEFEELSTTIPATFEEIAAVGEIGGQLGVGAQSITDFTETVINLRETTNLTADEAATALARIGNIYEVTSEQLGKNTERIGSTIVALGNNFATTESEIINFGLRIAGAGKIAGLSQAEILGLGAAFSSIGIEAEAGGTAVQKVLLAMNGAINATSDGFVDNSKKIDKNIARMTKLQAESARLEAQFPGLQDELLMQREAFIAAGGSAEEFGRQLGDKTRQKAFETAFAIQELQQETELLRQQQGQPIDPGQLAKFAEIAGLSADEFREKWGEDAAEAFQLFVEGLSKDGRNGEAALRDLGLADQRLIRAFLGLSEAGDVLNDTLTTAEEAWVDNNALSEEAQKRYATTAAKIQILKNSFTLLLAEIGERLLPLFNQVIEFAQRMVTEWAEPIGNAIDTIILPAIDSFILKVQEIGTVISGIVAGGGEGILQQLFGSTDLETIVSGLIAQIPTALGNLVTSITTFIQTQGPVIGETIRQWADAFWTWVDEVLPQVASVMAGIIAAIGAWIGGPGQTQVAELGFVLGQAFVDGMNLIFENQEKVTEVVGKIVAGLGVAAVAITAAIIAIGAQLVAGLIQGMLDKIGIDLQPALITELTQVFQSIKTNFVEAWKLIGTSVMEGFSQGIVEGYSNLLSVIGETVRIVIDAWKAELGISSPSTVFMEIGMNIIQGLIDGIMSLAGELPGLVTSIFGGLFSGEGGEALSFDFTGLLETLTTIIPNALTALGEFFTVMITGMNLQTTAFDLSWMNIATITMPMLTETFTSFSTMVIDSLQQMINLINEMISALLNLGSTAQAVATMIVKAFDKVAKSFDKTLKKMQELIQKINQAATAANKLADALERVAGAAAAASSGSSETVGVGFATGTNGVRTVPSGFPNDSFRMGLTSREEFAVAPPGQSLIESLLPQAMTGGDKIVKVEIGPVTISNDMDLDMFAARVQKIVSEGVAA